jgi:hypothetical protein
VKGIRKKIDNGRYPLSLGKEYVKHKLFGCPEFLSRKWLNIVRRLLTKRY